MRNLSLTYRRPLWFTSAQTLGLLACLLKDAVLGLGLSVDGAFTVGFIIGSVQMAVIIGLALWLGIWRREQAV